MTRLIKLYQVCIANLLFVLQSNWYYYFVYLFILGLESMCGTSADSLSVSICGCMDSTIIQTGSANGPTNGDYNKNDADVVEPIAIIIGLKYDVILRLSLIRPVLSSIITLINLSLTLEFKYLRRLALTLLKHTKIIMDRVS